VFFRSTSLSSSELTPFEESRKILFKMGVTKERITSWDEFSLPTSCFGLDGHLLYMNTPYRKVTGRGDSDLMNTYVFEVLMANDHLKATYRDVFMKLPETHSMDAEVTLELTKSKMTCSLLSVRQQFIHFLDTN
jgi:hypothetical protein